MHPRDRFNATQEKVRIYSAIELITKIQPHIHRVRLSSQRTGYKELVKCFGMIKLPDNYKKQVKNRMPHYSKMGYIQTKQSNLTVFWDTLIGGCPWSTIEVMDVDLPKLVELHNKLPGLKVSYVEYALDFFCDSPEGVSDVFYVLTRNLYFHHAIGILMTGGDYDGWREPRKENAVYRVQYRARKYKTRGAVIYERGPDHKKKYGIRWNHKDVDRVRLEFRDYRRSGRLKRMGIYTLFHLIKNPQFYNFCFKEKGQDEIQFKCFDSNRLPKYWQDYLAGYENNAVESLQVQYLDGKQILSNIGAFMHNHPFFDDLLNHIKVALKEFDQTWQTDAQVDLHNILLRKDS